MRTNTETNNFMPVTVSTSTVENKIETIIFFNGVEIWYTNKVQNIKEQHKIGVKVAESYTLTVGGENGCSEPFFRYK